jgi:glycosyltransferase involved in cell wall biosynthesis
MNILQINTAADTGGAGIAMARLHRGLVRQGHESRILARLRRSPQPDVLTIPEALGVQQTLVNRFLNNVRMQLDAWFVSPQVYGSTKRILDSELFEQADIIQLHNLHGWYFNYALLPQISARKPVIWTLHDMWAFTGHCAYSYECVRWQTGCFDCPLLRGDGRRLVEPRPTLLDRTSQQWQKKRDLYQASRLHIVTPSLWLADLVQRSILGNALSIQSIPYGIDLAVFSPREQVSARQALGIRQSAKVILFVAAKVIQGRKGLAYLYEALHSMQNTEEIVLLTVGSAGPSHQQLQHFEQIHLGQVADESRLNLAYSAADVYVLPTLADNQPLTVLESLASGTPVVAFDVGGVPEMITHLHTGYLARYKDAIDLAAGILEILDNDALRARMRQSCRAAAIAGHDLENQAFRYVELYGRAIRTHQQHATGGNR